MSSGPSSCAECRRRKIRCDRKHPCSYCAKNHILCVFPTPAETRVPTRRRAGSAPQSDPSLLARIQDLESRVQLSEERLRQLEEWQGLAVSEKVSRSPPNVVSYERGPAGTSDASWSNTKSPMPLLRQMTSSSGIDMPDKDAMYGVWTAYRIEVDPLLKLVDPQYVRTGLDLYPKAPAESMALLAAIYYAREVCRRQVTVAEFSSLASYTESSFQATRIPTDPSIIKLQALTIYLTCGRVHMEQERLREMLSMLVRLALQLQLDRDPVELGYLPAECEHRRRLWWHIVALDVRSAEACRGRPLIQPRQGTSKFPLNVRDAKLRASISMDYREHTPCTVFAVAAVEMAALAKQSASSVGRGVDLTSRLNASDQRHRSLLDRCRRECDCLDSPICRLTEAWCQIYWKRQHLLLVHWDQVNLKQVASNVSSNAAKSALATSTAILELVQSLRNDAEYSQWAWLWHNCVEWDAAAVALSMIASAACEPEHVRRAWAAIHTFFAAWKGPFGDPEHQKRWRELEVFREWVQSFIAE